MEERPRRTVKSFVLRQGRVSNAQQRAWDTLFPRFGIAFSETPLDARSVFGRSAPLILEIGSGMGETSVAIARLIRKTTTSPSKSTCRASAACSNRSTRQASPTCA